MDETERRAAVERYVAAYNAFDVSGMLRELHDDVLFRNVSGGAVTHETRGVDAFREQAEEGAALFASRMQTIVALSPVDDGGRPGLRATIRYGAVLARDLPNGMTAGQALALEGESEFRFENGRIVSIIDAS